MEAWVCQTPGPGALLGEQKPTLCGALEDGQLGRAECLRDLTFRPLVEDLGHGKGRRSERLPCGQRAAERGGVCAYLAARGREEHDKRVCLGEGGAGRAGLHALCQQVGNFGELQALHAPACLLSSEVPHSHTQPDAPASEPAGTGSRTSSHCAGGRPARGRPRPPQLETQSTEASTCVLGPLALTPETHNADRNQEADLSSPQAGAPRPYGPQPPSTGLSSSRD